MGSANITLEEIIRRRLEFISEELEAAAEESFGDDDELLAYDEFKAQCDGEMSVYRDMLVLLRRGISEEEFIERYLRRMEECGHASRVVGDNENVIDISTGRSKSEIERWKLGGSFAAIKEILNMFFPLYTDEDFE